MEDSPVPLEAGKQTQSQTRKDVGTTKETILLFRAVSPS